MSHSAVSESKINNILRLVQSKCEDEALSHLKEILPYCDWVKLSYKDTGDTILHCAARNGLDNFVKFLLDSFLRIDIDCRNKDDKTPLHEAAQFSHFRTCETLLNYGATLNVLKRGDWTPLMLACTKRNAMKTVEVLLSRGADIDYENKDGWTSLHLASRVGDENMVKCLIKNHTNVNLRTKNGRSALHIAALHGNLAVVDILLNLRLAVNDKDHCGNSALCEAILGNHIEVCLKLLEYGGDSTIINNSGYSLIHLAASKGHIEMLEFILKTLKIDVNIINKNNLTALHCAARKKKKEAYAYLVMNGALENIPDKHNRTPLEYLNA